jgi:hypothetical protein
MRTIITVHLPIDKAPDRRDCPATRPYQCDTAAARAGTLSGAATIDLRLARHKRISELNDLLTERRSDLCTRLRDSARLP